MKQMLEQIASFGILPVISIKNEADALPLGRALLDGGLPAAEITFRTPAAAAAIAAMTAAYPDILVGAGTVLTVEQADAAIAAGAKFLVSPGLNPTVVRHAQDKGVLMIPGCATPSDFEAAMALGLTTVKFFPAETLGGVKAIKAMTAPYGGLRIMATGGIDLHNMAEYLACPAIAAVGGSFVAPTADISAGNFAAITANARAAVAAVLGFSLEHIGVYFDDAAERDAAADTLAKVFGFMPDRRNDDCVFADRHVELLTCAKRGTLGHIAIRTPSVDRAYAYLKRAGVAFDESSIAYAPDGRMNLVFLRDEIGGYAYHLIRK